MTQYIEWPAELAPSNHGRHRFYPTPDGDFPSVTTADGVLGLSKAPLMAWSANTERAAVLEAAADVFAEGAHDDGPAGFIAAVEARIGKARAHQKLVSKAADIGTAAHQMIQWTLRKELGLPVGPEPQLGDESLWAFMSWQDWYKTAGLKPVRTEQVVWDKEYGYAGCIDFIAEAPDEVLEVWDWKSSKGCYPDHHIQLAAYIHAARNWAPNIRAGGIVRIPKNIGDPKAEVIRLGKLYDREVSEADLFRSFTNCLDLWNVLVREDK